MNRQDYMALRIPESLCCGIEHQVPPSYQSGMSMGNSSVSLLGHKDAVDTLLSIYSRCVAWLLSFPQDSSRSFE